MRAIALVALVSACSGIVMVPVEPGSHVACTESELPGAVDMLAAITAVGFAAKAFVSNDVAPRDAEAIGGALAIGAAAFALSSWYGFHEASRCRRAKASER